jgi:hypothetical protein
VSELPQSARQCGTCRLWRHLSDDERGPVGPCRLLVRLGDVPASAPPCERYLDRGEAVPSALPLEPERQRRAGALRAVVVHRPGEDLPVTTYVAVARPAPASLPPLPEELTDMTREEFAQAIREALREETSEVRLANKWEGGSVVLKPGDPGTAPKEIPLDALLHKIVMIRDRLRVLEAKLNAHEKLSDAEKVDFQQYVTRCYGSLTTFNVLFKDEKDRFVGEKGAGG